MPINYQQRVFFMLVCLLLAIVLPSCIALENDIEPQAEMEVDVDVVETTINEELSNSMIVEEIEVELYTNSTSADKFVSLVSAASWPTQKCEFGTEIVDVTFDYSQGSTISEASVVFIDDYAVALWEWIPNSQKVLIQRMTVDNSPIEILDIETGESTTYATPTYSSKPIWIDQDEKLLYANVDVNGDIKLVESSTSDTRSNNESVNTFVRTLSSLSLDRNVHTNWIVASTEQNSEILIFSDQGALDFYSLSGQEIKFSKWSSNGKFLSVYTHSNELWVFNMVDRSVCNLDFNFLFEAMKTEDTFQSVEEMIFSPAHNQLVLALGLGEGDRFESMGLAVANLDSEQLTFVRGDQSSGWGSVTSMAWSPDGDFIAISTWLGAEADNQIHIYDIHHRQVTASSEVTNNGWSFNSLLWSSDGNKLMHTSYGLGEVHLRVRDVTIISD